MRKPASLIAFFLMILLLFASAWPLLAAEPSPAFKAAWDKLVADAKKEGDVVIYTSITPSPREAIKKAFKKKFGINLEFIGGRGEEALVRLQTERRAGLYTGDLFLHGGTTLLTLVKPVGILQVMDNLLILPEINDPKVWRDGKMPFYDKDHTTVAMIAGFHRYVLRNTNLIKEGDVKSYRDLLRPEFKGKIAMQDPTVTGTGSAFVTKLALGVWDVETAKQYLRELAKQEPAITRDKRLLVEWVARGKYPLGVAVDFESVSDFLKAGAPVDVVYVAEGGKLSVGAGGLAVLDKPAHPNAAKLFVNWLLTREGQTIFASAFGYPSRRVDVPQDLFDPRLFPRPGEKVIEDSEVETMWRGNAIPIAKQIFGHLLK